MQHDHTFRRRKMLKARRILGALVLGTGLLATPALARHKDPVSHRHRPQHHGKHVHAGPSGYVKHHHHGHPVGHGHRSHAAGHRSFVIPRWIAPVSLDAYRPYYHGRVYYRPHRHRHALYYFPVLTPAGWVERPHFYCQGSLFESHVAYRSPRFSFSVRF